MPFEMTRGCTLVADADNAPHLHEPATRVQTLEALHGLKRRVTVFAEPQNCTTVTALRNSYTPYIHASKIPPIRMSHLNNRPSQTNRGRRFDVFSWLYLGHDPFVFGLPFPSPSYRAATAFSPPPPHLSPTTRLTTRLGAVLKKIPRPQPSRLTIRGWRM
jgi:hypothetical protein